KEWYPDSAARRKLYKTSLSPRSATLLLDRAEEIRRRLQDGVGYGWWDTEERFAFVRDVVAMLSEVPSFRIGRKLGRRKNFEDWPVVLRWWLAKSTLPEPPPVSRVTSWFDYVSENFIYRATWGLGSLLGVLLEEG